jgi:16S rRNA (uracil1498-N3)-methyltransferase
MRNTRVFIEAGLVNGDIITLDKARAHYLKNVLRLKPGAAFFLFNGKDAIDYEARLIVEGKRLAAEILAARPLATEPEVTTELIQGLGRSDHVDWTIQKTTELGVNRVSIFNAARTQSPLKPAQLEKKLSHWRSVAISACEQCGRAIVPEIRFHTGPEAALAATAATCKLILDFAGNPLASTLQDTRSPVSILLGPEGGLTDREIDLARESGFQPVSLGIRVLRTETAATAALAIVQSTLGNI